MRLDCFFVYVIFFPNESAILNVLKQNIVLRVNVYVTTIYKQTNKQRDILYDTII